MANTPVRRKHNTQVTLTLTQNSIAAGAGRVSTQISLDDNALATDGKNVATLKLKIKVTSGSVAPAAGGTYEYYLVRGDGTDQDAAFGATDAAWSDGTFRDQLEFIGAIVVTNTASKTYIVTFQITNPGPNISIAFWNGTSQTSDTTAGNFYAKIGPETDNIVA